MSEKEVLDFIYNIDAKIDNNELTKEEVEKLIKKVEFYIEEGSVGSIAVIPSDLKQCPQLFSVKTSFDVEPNKISDEEWSRFVEQGKLTLCLSQIEDPQDLVEKFGVSDMLKEVELLLDEKCYPGLQEGLQQMIQIYGNEQKILEKGKKHFREKLRDNYYKRKGMYITKGSLQCLYVNLLHQQISLCTDPIERDKLYRKLEMVIQDGEVVPKEPHII